MTDFYQVYVKDGQSITDVAMQEYGVADGVVWILQDNVGTVSEISDEPVAGTVLNIRFAPPVDPKVLIYVRPVDKQYMLINVNEAGATEITVKNSDNSYNVTAGGPIFTLPDISIKKSDGTVLRTVPAVENETIGDVVIFKADGVTHLEDIKAEGSKTSTQILEAMTGAEIIADLNTNGDPELSVVRSYFEQTWALTITFNNAVTKNVRFRFGQSVQITALSATLGAYTGGTVYKNETASALPVTFSYQDELRLNFTTLTADVGTGTTVVVLSGVFVSEAFAETVKAGAVRQNEIYVNANGLIFVYQPDLRKFTHQILKNHNGSTVQWIQRFARKLYFHFNNQLIECDCDTLIATGNVFSAYSNSAALSWITKAGVLYDTEGGSAGPGLYKVNTTTFVVTVSAGSSLAAMNNATRITICGYYNGNILVSGDTSWGAVYSVAGNSWANYTNLSASALTVQTTHIDSIGGFIYYISGGNLWRASATDLSGAAVYKAFGYGGTVMYMAISGNTCYLITLNGTALKLFVRDIPTNTELAQVNLINTFSIGSYVKAIFAVLDTDRNCIYVTNVSAVLVVDLTTYTIAATTPGPVPTGMLSDFDNPKIYY